MLRLVKYLKPYWWQIVLLVGFVCGQVWCNLQLPDYMADIVDRGIVAENQSEIWSIGIQMIGVTLAGTISAIIAGFLAARVGTGFARDVREEVFTTVESFSMTEFDRFSTASLITRSTNDIQQVQMVLIMVLRLVVMAPIMGAGAVWKAYHAAPSMWWVMGVGVLIIFALIAVMFGFALPKFRVIQTLVDRIGRVTRENLTGLRVIRAFDNEDLEEKRFDVENRELTRINLFVNRLVSAMMPAMMLVFNFTSLLIVWIGAHMVPDGKLQIGDMLAFMQYAMQVLMSFLMVSMVFIMIPRASVAGRRIADVIHTVPQLRDPERPTPIPALPTTTVRFDNVTFAYPDADEPALANVSFTATSGQTTAIIGSTGSGKSTLINLIPRFYDVTSGSITINGVDVRAMTAHDLAEAIGYVPQKGILFSGTIRSNILYGVPDAPDATMVAAAQTAQATEFIDELVEGYDSPIAEGATNVSGGQRQRLAIARALAKDPKVLIFDDSFSALDFRTDAALRAALAPTTADKATIIVAQRISTIMHAEQIIVLDDGQIAGIGRHRDLLETCTVYREIASSQLSEDELASGDEEGRS